MAGNQAESNFVDGGDQSPTGSASVQGGSSTSIDIDALLANPKFAEALDRRLQATKDKRIAGQEKQLSEFRAKLERLEALTKDGMSRSQALMFMDIEDRLENLSGQPAKVAQAQAPTGGGKKSQSEVDADAFLKAVGVDPNDPEVTEMLRNGGITPEGLINLTVRRKTATPSPSPAQAAPSGGGTTSREELMEKYRKEVDALQPGSEEIYAIRAKYREQGLVI